MLALVVLWIAGGAYFYRELVARSEARVRETAQAAAGVVQTAGQGLAREAALLAREPAVVAGALKADWSALAQGASSRMAALSVDRLADVLLVTDPAGQVVVQVPATPRLSATGLVPPSSPLTGVRTLGPSTYLVGLAPIRAAAAPERSPAAGLAVVGRRLEHVERELLAAHPHAALVAIAGDRLQASTRRVPAEGWTAIAASGRLTVQGETWYLRRIAEAGELALWALVADPAAAAEQRWLAVMLGGSLLLGASAAVAAVITVARASRRQAAESQRRRARPDIERRNRELEALYAAALTIGGHDDVASTAQHALDVVRGVAETEAAAVYRLDSRRCHLMLVASRGLPPAEAERLRARPLEGRIGEAARTGSMKATDTELVLPIPMKGSTWGVLALTSGQRRRFDADEITLLQAVAHQVGLAVARATLLAETREKSRRLETLTRLARGLTATLSGEEVLQGVVDAARELLNPTIARLWLVDDDGQNVSLGAQAGMRSAAGLRQIPVGEGLVGTVVARREVINVPDIQADPRMLNLDRLRAEGIVSCAGVPLLAGDRIVGALAIGTVEPHEYSAEELDLLQSLANHAAIALDNARLFFDEQARRAYLGALLEINKKIGAMAPREALLTSIAEEAARLLAVDNAGFRLLEGDDLVLAGLAGTAAETMLRPRLKVGQSFSGRVVAEGRSLILDLDAAADIVAEHFAADQRLGYTTFLGVPLQVAGRTIGVLSFRARRPFTTRDQELAEAFAGQAAIAIEHARLYREAAGHAERMRALADLGRLLSETLDPAVVGQRAADSICTLLGAKSSALYRLGDGGELVAVTEHQPTPTIFEWTQVLAPDTGLASLAVRERDAVSSPDVLADTRLTYAPELRERVEGSEHRAMIAVPLRVQDRLFGALAVSDRTGRVFDAEEARLAQAFADEAALALENARLYAETTSRRREAEELAALASRLTENLDVSDVVERTVESVLPMFNAQSSVVRLQQPDGSLVALALGGRSREYLEPGHVLPGGAGVLGRAVAESRPVWSPDAVADTSLAMSDELRRDLTAAGESAILAVPMRAKGVVIGALGIADRPGRVYTEHEAALLQAFADQATLALENARLFSMERSRRRQIAMLAELERELAAELDPDRLLHLIVERSTRLFNANGGIYMLEGDRLVPRAWTENGTFPDVVLSLGEGLAGRAAQERRGLIDNEYGRQPHSLPRFVEAGIRFAIAHPLVLRDQLIGVITMNRTDVTASAFLADDLTLLESFAAQAAIAIQNARLYQEARAYADRLRALEEVNRLVSSSLNVEEVLRNLARAIAQFFDARYVSLWAFDTGSGRLRRALTYGDDALAAEMRDDLALGEGAVGWAVLHREPILWTDVRTDARFVDAEPMVNHGVPWITAYPIAIGDRLLGAFAVNRAAAWPVTPETASLMGSLAAQAAIALENARLYSETTRRLMETRALLEVAEILNSTLDSRQLLKRVAVKVAQVCRVDRCAFELWDGDRVVPLMSQYADGRKNDAQWSRYLAAPPASPRQVPAYARAIDTRQPVTVDDAAGSDQIPRDWVDTYGIKSYMVVPLIRQDQVIGAMSLDYCDAPARFADWQCDLAMAIAGQLTLSLDNTRLYAAAQERLRETTTLLAVGRTLSQPGPTDEVMRRLAAEVARAFGADTVGAYTFDARRGRLTPVAGYHVPKPLLELFIERPVRVDRSPWLAEAWQHGRAAWSPDVLNDDRFDEQWKRDLPPHAVLFVPTMAHGVGVGGLFLLWWETGRTFEPAEIRLAEGVAGQVGLAIENAELSRQTQAKLAETETLLAVSRALSSTVDFHEVVRLFLRQVLTAIDADSVGLWMANESGEWLAPDYGYRVPPGIREATRPMRISVVEHAFYADAVRAKRPLFSADVHAEPRIPREFLERVPHRAQLFAPVIAKDRLIGGFIGVWWERTREFSESDLALMETIANQAGVAFENARLFEENRRRVEELSVLHDLSRAVTGQLDRAALIDAIRSQVARVLDVRNMVMILRDEERQELDVVLRVVDGHVDTAPPLRYPLTSVGLMSVVLERGHAIRTEDYEAECERHGVRAIPASSDLRHWLGVPMAAGERVLGVVALRGGERPFTDADERLLLNIAHLAALALSSARLFEERTKAFGELAAAQDQLVRTEKLRALGEMASGVAHDFNNLLASVLGRAQLLLRRIRDPQLRQWLEVIERSALDGAQTVRRLQEFTRIRRDQPLVPLDLNQVVRDALDITQSRWGEEPMSRGIAIEVRTALAPVPPVVGDAAELREAMTNLILNAVDAMPDGGLLTLATGVVDDRVEVMVTDTGVGMSAAVREKIFDPFFTTKGPQGTGLGLSMTYGIISRHNASIAVESEEGKGSTFRLTFERASDLAAAAGPVVRPAPAVRSLRCLVVDDEEPVRTVLGDILESAGHSVVVLADGGEAIARVRAEPFDLVLTDLAMPRVSGWQVARGVKQAAPSVPVFLVTGFGVELSAEERRAHGVDAVLVKPLQIQEILDAVAEVARALPQTP